MDPAAPSTSTFLRRLTRPSASWTASVARRTSAPQPPSPCLARSDFVHSSGCAATTSSRSARADLSAASRARRHQSVKEPRHLVQRTALGADIFSTCSSADRPRQSRVHRDDALRQTFTPFHERPERSDAKPRVRSAGSASAWTAANNAVTSRMKPGQTDDEARGPALRLATKSCRLALLPHQHDTMGLPAPGGQGPCPRRCDTHLRSIQTSLLRATKSLPCSVTFAMAASASGRSRPRRQSHPRGSPASHPPRLAVPPNSGRTRSQRDGLCVSDRPPALLREGCPEGSSLGSSSGKSSFRSNEHILT